MAHHVSTKNVTSEARLFTHVRHSSRAASKPTDQKTTKRTQAPPNHKKIKKLPHLSNPGEPPLHLHDPRRTTRVRAHACRGRHYMM